VRLSHSLTLLLLTARRECICASECVLSRRRVYFIYIQKLFARAVRRSVSSGGIKIGSSSYAKCRSSAADCGLAVLLLAPRARLCVTLSRVHQFSSAARPRPALRRALIAFSAGPSRGLRRRRNSAQLHQTHLQHAQHREFSI
jgi:hypothetical protein